MERKEYGIVIKIALVFMAIAIALTAIITRNMNDIAGIIVGGITGIGGFIWITIMVKQISLDENVKTIVFINYMFRFFVYAAIFVVAMQFGANIITMLIGFICMNLALKAYTMGLDKKLKPKGGE